MLQNSHGSAFARVARDGAAPFTEAREDTLTTRAASPCGRSSLQDGGRIERTPSRSRVKPMADVSIDGRLTAYVSGGCSLAARLPARS